MTSGNLLMAGAAALVMTFTIAAPVRAMPVAPSAALAPSAQPSATTEIRWKKHRHHSSRYVYRGRHANRGNHYGWGRGRGHHYGWSRGRGHRDGMRHDRRY